MARTLEDALKEVLADDNKINRYEARVIREMIMADGVVDHYESTYAVNLRTKMNLTMEQAIRARRMAEGGEDLTLEQAELSSEPTDI